MDVAKRLIDLGFHPSTVYFPLVVEEAMMVEPTETESKETLDAFAEALQVAREAAGPRPAARGAGDRAGPAARRGAGGPRADAPLVAKVVVPRRGSGNGSCRPVRASAQQPCGLPG